MPYINDDWKVTSKLTLNLGLRFDFGTNPHSIMNNMLVITNPPFNSVGGHDLHRLYAGAERVGEQSQ